MLSDNVHIDSARTIQKRIKQVTQEEISIKRIQNVMTKEMDMHYSKMKNISLHANSHTNLILRQRYAIKLLELSKKKTIIVNIDETWLDASDYRRFRWKPKHYSNSNPIVQVAPRISMILCMDTLGNVYLSLTQSNSNS